MRTSKPQPKQTLANPRCLSRPRLSRAADNTIIFAFYFLIQCALVSPLPLWAPGVEYSLELSSGDQKYFQCMFNEWPVKTPLNMSAQPRGEDEEKIDMELEEASAEAGGLGFKEDASGNRSRSKGRGRKPDRSPSKRMRERETTAVPSTPTQLQDSSTDSSDDDQAVLSAEQAKVFPKELPPWFGDSLRMQSTQNKKDFKKILKKKFTKYQSKQNERLADVEVKYETHDKRLDEHQDHLKQQDQDIQHLVTHKLKTEERVTDLEAQATSHGSDIGQLASRVLQLEQKKPAPFTFPQANPYGGGGTGSHASTAAQPAVNPRSREATLDEADKNKIRIRGWKIAQL